MGTTTYFDDFKYRSLVIAWTCCKCLTLLVGGIHETAARLSLRADHSFGPYIFVFLVQPLFKLNQFLFGICMYLFFHAVRLGEKRTEGFKNG